MFVRKSLTAFFIAILPLNILMADTIPCSDMLYLVEQSASGFSSIKGDTESEFGGFSATKILPNAQYCVVLEDPEKRTYKCTWKYSIGDERAMAAFEQYATEVENCLGDSARRLKDQPVNHPDTYKSYLYKLTDTDMRVTFKDKSELMSTLVSVVFEGVNTSRITQ